MRDEHDRAPGLAQVLHPTETPALELGVTDGQHLVDEQDLRLEVRGDRECQAHGHPARVPLHRSVEERLDTGEVDDLVELADTISRLLHPEDRAVQEDVLATRQLRVEAGPDLEQAADASANLRSTLASATRSG